MSEPKKEKPGYVYINPADAGDFLKYGTIASRLSMVAQVNGKPASSYVAYVQEDIFNMGMGHSHIVCILN